MKPLLFTNIDNKAEDSNVLHITGNEEIEGTKNFNTAPKIANVNIPSDTDAVHKSNDETINGVKNFTSIPTINGSNLAKDSDVVHKSGDTITGNIILSNAQLLNTSTYFGIVNTNESNSGYIDIRASTNWENGALLTLYAKDFNDSTLNGGFKLESHCGSEISHLLRGYKTGILSWDNQELPMPVGTIIFAGSQTSTSNLTGYLWCNGAAVSRTTYARLFQAIGTSYGAGDGSTTFNLPLLNDGRFIECGDVDETSTNNYHSAGLPNIIGTFGDINGSIHFSNAFYGTDSQNACASITSTTDTYYRVHNFNASRCSSIYGNSTTVQPKSIILYAYIKY